MTIICFAGIGKSLDHFYLSTIYPSGSARLKVKIITFHSKHDVNVYTKVHGNPANSSGVFHEKNTTKTKNSIIST